MVVIVVLLVPWVGTGAGPYVRQGLEVDLRITHVNIKSPYGYAGKISTYCTGELNNTDTVLVK